MSRLRVNAIELKRVNVVQHTSVPEFQLLRMRAGDPKVKLSMRIRADALVASRAKAEAFSPCLTCGVNYG